MGSKDLSAIFDQATPVAALSADRMTLYIRYLQASRLGNEFPATPRDTAWGMTNFDAPFIYSKITEAFNCSNQSVTIKFVFSNFPTTRLYEGNAASSTLIWEQPQANAGLGRFVESGGYYSGGFAIPGPYPHDPNSAGHGYRDPDCLIGSDSVFANVALSGIDCDAALLNWP